MSDAPEFSQIVRDKYGDAARRVLSARPTLPLASAGACCAPAPGHDQLVLRRRRLRRTDRSDHVESLREWRDRRAARSGRPRVARLRQSHRARRAAARRDVLDLGSGGGIDVLLSARRVGPTGKAYGLDMTDSMLELARRNQAEAGVDERRVPQGRASSRSRFPDASVDVIISELRDQSLGRQAQGAGRGVSRAQAGRPIRGERCDRARRGAGRGARRAWSSGWAALLARSRSRSSSGCSGRSASRIPTFEPTRFYSASDAAAFLAQSGLDVDRGCARDRRKVPERVRARGEAGDEHARAAAAMLLVDRIHSPCDGSHMTQSI